MNRHNHTVVFRMLVVWLTIADLHTTPSANAQPNTSGAPEKASPTNHYWTALPVDPQSYNNPYHISLFNPQNGEDSARIWSQTKALFVSGTGVALFLAALPESATGWETEGDIFGKWVENVTEGPIWDRNNWAYNYIGHAYAGGVYYQVARKSGYRQWDAFFYTTLMSTFCWEYGIEAFAEVPSIQDLVYTPLIGWVYGEWAFKTEIGIREQNNEVAGSNILGEASLFVLDPIDSLGRVINRITGRKWLKSGYGYFSYTAIPDGTDTERTVYLNMRVPIGEKPNSQSEHKLCYTEYRNDPVDTGIVGFGIGTGHTMLDDSWEIEDDFFTQFSLGLYFTPHFSTRLTYARADLQKDAGSSVIFENYSLDAQYYLNARRKFRPYFTAGLGEQLWNENEHQKTFQWNAGLGLHWQFLRKWALQADWINYINTSTDTYDQTANIGLIYRFGSGEHDDW